MFSNPTIKESVNIEVLKQHQRRFTEKTKDTLTKEDVTTLWNLYHEQRSVAAAELRETYKGKSIVPTLSEFNKQQNQIAFERVRSILVPNVTKSELWSLFHKYLIPKKGRTGSSNSTSRINSSIIKRTKRYFKIDDEMLVLLEKQVKDLKIGETIEIEFTTQAYARLALKLMPKVAEKQGWTPTTIEFMPRYNAKVLRKKVLVVELTR